MAIRQRLSDPHPHPPRSISHLPTVLVPPQVWSLFWVNMASGRQRGVVVFGDVSAALKNTSGGDHNSFGECYGAAELNKNSH